MRVFRACPVHACALVEVSHGEPDGPHALHAFALHMRGREVEIARLSAPLYDKLFPHHVADYDRRFRPPEA